MRPILPLLRLSTLAGLGLLLVCSELSAQSYNATPGVPVRVWGEGFGRKTSGDSAQIEVSGGGFLYARSSGADSITLTGSTDSVVGDWFQTSTTDTVHMEAGKVYGITVSGVFAGGIVPNVALNLAPPLGFDIEIEGERRQRAEVYSGHDNQSVSYTFMVRLLGSREHAFMAAGSASELMLGRIYWQVGLGGLRNGKAAGSIAIVDPGTESDWSALYTPSALQYESPSDEVIVLHGTGNVLRQVIANQAVVDIVAASSTAYDINFYHPDQAIGSGDTLRTFTGQPYLKYQVEQGTSSTTLQITGTSRNTTADNSWTTDTPARVAVTSLLRTGSGLTDFSWTRSDWNTSGETQVSEQVTTSAGTIADRTDTVVVRPGGGGDNASYQARAYHKFSWGEEIVSSSTGSTNAMTTAFDYYDNAAEVGRHGFLKSTVTPGGGWEAYDYWDATSSTGTNRIGTLRFRYRPFGNTPTGVAFNATQGEVTEYVFGVDPFGIATRPTLVETRVNNIVTSSSSTTYTETAVNVYGTGAEVMVTAVRSDSTSASAALTTTTKLFREDTADLFLRNQFHSVTRPDNVKVSYAYQRGDFSDGAFTASSTGAASRITSITGIVGSSYSSFDGYDIDNLALVAGKSTLETVIRDSRALIRRTESYVWVSDAWRLVGWINFDYDTMGNLVGRTASNGSTSESVYDGTQKSYDVAENGVRTDYDYDYAGRLLTSSKRNTANTAFTTTVTYDYDVAGRALSETVSGNGTSETIVTSRSYDDAGRLKGETPAGTTPVSGHVSTIEHSYSYDSATGLSAHTVSTPATGAYTTRTHGRDGRLVAVTGDGVVSSHYTYGVDVSTGQRISRVDTGSPSSPRYQKIWTDLLDRTIKTERPGFGSGSSPQEVLITENFYDDATVGLGRLYRTTSTDSPPSLQVYDELGSVIRSGVDANAGGTLVNDSADRITEKDQVVESHDGAYWLVSTTRACFPGDTTPTPTGLSWQRLTGHGAVGGTAIISETRSWDVEDLSLAPLSPTSVTTVEVNRGTKTVVNKTVAAGLPTATESKSVNGLATETKSSDGLVYTSEYDALERVSRARNPRHSTAGGGNIGYTVNTYKAGTGLVESVFDAAGNPVTFSEYDNLGRVTSTRNADGKYTRVAYNIFGQVERQWGDATHPVAYGYNTYGERTSMSTYRGAPAADSTAWPSVGPADVTTWTFDPATGLLWKKKDEDDHEVELSYNRRGQTATRTLARSIPAGLPNAGQRVRTVYDYYETLAGTSVPGELRQVSSNDSNTPAVTTTYDRLGRTATVDQVGVGLRTFHYDPEKPWRLLDETLPAFFGSRVLTGLYEETTTSGSGTGTQRGRGKGFQLGIAGNTARDLEQAWTYTDQPRFASLQARLGAGTAQGFAYTYVTDATTSFPLFHGYTTTAPGGAAFAVSRDYEADRDLVTRLESKWGTDATPRARFDYTHDDLGRRLTAKHSGGAYADYTAGQSYGAVYNRYAYNARNELESSRMYGGDDSASTANELPGRRFEYRYDSIGNRKSSGPSGSSNGTVDVSGSGDDNYTVNALNQYTGRENNEVAVTGTVAGGANVAMLGVNAPLTRVDRAWSHPLTPDNTAGPAIGEVTVYGAVPASGGNPNFVLMDSRTWVAPKRQEQFEYDADGNLTQDSLWTYTYDGENRLIRLSSRVASGFGAGFTPAYVRHWIDFKYDHMGRRIEKAVYDLDEAGFSQVRRFVYDGWNLVAELNGTGATIQRSYTWGLDLTGAPTKAGGISALMRITHYSSGTAGASYYPAYDGNGNVIALVNATSGAFAAIYEYDPFGNLIRNQVLDPAVADNPFRFSTKYRDAETGLCYYGLRYYSPSLGRFLNQDPIEEAGGLNLYGFCGNNGVNRWDYLGQAWNHGGEIGTDKIVARDPDWYDLYGTGGSWDIGPSMSGVAVVAGSGHSAGMNAVLTNIANRQFATDLFNYGMSVINVASGIVGNPLQASFSAQTSSLPTYTVTHNTQTGTTTGSVGGNTVSYTTSSGYSGVLDQISGAWSYSTPTGSLAAHSAAVGYAPASTAPQEMQNASGADADSGGSLLADIGNTIREIAMPTVNAVVAPLAYAASAMGAALDDLSYKLGAAGIIDPTMARGGLNAVITFSPQLIAAARTTAFAGLAAETTALRAGQVFETDVLAAQNLAKNTGVWRPTAAQIDSAAFKVIVGDARYTSTGLARGTIMDSVQGGFLEIKGGSSVLDFTEQLRLQTYRSLIESTPYTIQTTRPVSIEFGQWLSRWGGRIEAPPGVP